MGHRVRLLPNFKWNDELDETLRRMWKAGDRVVRIAAVLGNTRSAVVGRARRLDLGDHPDARPSGRRPRAPKLLLLSVDGRAPRKPPRQHLVAIEEPLRLKELSKMEPAERDKLVRMPQIMFLTHRLPWELDAR